MTLRILNLQDVFLLVSFDKDTGLFYKYDISNIAVSLPLELQGNHTGQPLTGLRGIFFSVLHGSWGHLEHLCANLHLCANVLNSELVSFVCPC